jgi:hypothetical protein
MTASHYQKIAWIDANGRSQRCRGVSVLCPQNFHDVNHVLKLAQSWGLQSDIAACRWVELTNVSCQTDRFDEKRRT